MYVKGFLKGTWIFAAAVLCAAVFGVGVPLGWVWIASQVQPTVGQGTSDLAALIVIAGPLASYIALIVVAGRFTAPREGVAHPQRMAWNRSRDEVRESARHSTPFEQVVLLATLIVLLGFDVWFFFSAHQQPWGSS